jgi:hypothetical protein
MSDNKKYVYSKVYTDDYVCAGFFQFLKNFSRIIGISCNKYQPPGESQCERENEKRSFLFPYWPGKEVILYESIFVKPITIKKTQSSDTGRFSDNHLISI